MSLSYPDREKWLAVRCTPRRNPPGKYLFVSTHYGWLELPRAGVPRRFVKMGPGRTYRKPT